MFDKNSQTIISFFTELVLIYDIHFSYNSVAADKKDHKAAH